MPRITAPSLVRKPDDDDHPPSTEALLQRVRSAVDDAVAFVRDRAVEPGPVAFMSVERELVPLVLAAGRALVVLFLALREQQVAQDGRVAGLSGGFRPAPPIARNLTTWFVTVRYWRQYMREEGEVRGRRRRGFHPLDRALGLLSDRLSFNVLSVAVRLATKLRLASTRRSFGRE
jgi:hypothetical protein